MKYGGQGGWRAVKRLNRDARIADGSSPYGYRTRYDQTSGSSRSADASPGWLAGAAAVLLLLVLILPKPAQFVGVGLGAFVLLIGGLKLLHMRASGAFDLEWSDADLRMTDLTTVRAKIGSHRLQVIPSETDVTIVNGKQRVARVFPTMRLLGEHRIVIIERSDPSFSFAYGRDGSVHIRRRFGFAAASIACQSEHHKLALMIEEPGAPRSG